MRLKYEHTTLIHVVGQRGGFQHVQCSYNSSLVSAFTSSLFRYCTALLLNTASYRFYTCCEAMMLHSKAALRLLYHQIPRNSTLPSAPPFVLWQQLMWGKHRSTGRAERYRGLRLHAHSVALLLRFGCGFLHKKLMLRREAVAYVKRILQARTLIALTIGSRSAHKLVQPPNQCTAAACGGPPLRQGTLAQCPNLAHTRYTIHVAGDIYGR